MKALLYKADTGLVVQAAHGPADAIEKMAEVLGCLAYETDNETAVRVLPDFTLVEAIASIDRLKAARRDEARAYRDQRKAGGCLTALGKIDTDPSSMDELNTMAAVAASSIAAKVAFPYKTWTRADGTDVDLTPLKGATAQAVVAKMRNACQQAYLAIKDKIDAASTIEAVAAIDITAGYPA